MILLGGAFKLYFYWQCFASPGQIITISEPRARDPVENNFWALESNVYVAEAKKIRTNIK